MQAQELGFGERQSVKGTSVPRFFEKVNRYLPSYWIRACGAKPPRQSVKATNVPRIFKKLIGTYLLVRACGAKPPN